MDKSKAALGSTIMESIATCLTIDPINLTPEERIFLLEEQMRHMQRIIIRMKKQQIAVDDPNAPLPVPSNSNKDGIPIGTVCFGATEKSPFLYYLTTAEDGYVIGSKKFESLSAAAEAVSMVRRSGWTFWKTLDGRTLKEAYRT
jgi:hypothetical protein